MGDSIATVRDLLHEAAEAHHQVFRMTDGADDDWASWYATWLTRHSELPEVLGRAPVRSELTFHLVGLDREYSAATPGQEPPWEEFYARRLVEVFGGRPDARK